jgi:hypothetical protein
MHQMASSPRGSSLYVPGARGTIMRLLALLLVAAALVELALWALA